MNAASSPASLEAEALEALFDVLPVAIVLFDAASKRFALNARAAELLGIAEGERSLGSFAEQQPGLAGLDGALSSSARAEQLQLEVSVASAARTLLVDTYPLASGGSVSWVRPPPRAGGDDVVAHLAHKLNNPLSTILMSAQLASDGSAVANAERMARLLGKIQENARRCGKILDDAVNGVLPQR